MNNFNFDENTINKFKNMVNNGELNDVISKIPPEMMHNFSSIMNNNSDQGSNNNYNINNNSSNSNSNTTNFDFNNIDMDTIIKMKSIMENMNRKNDPRTNLLNSLKPYLRDSRKEKIDQYANLLNFANIAELLRTDNNRSSSKSNNSINEDKTDV